MQEAGVRSEGDNSAGVTGEDDVMAEGGADDSVKRGQHDDSVTPKDSEDMEKGEEEEGEEEEEEEEEPPEMTPEERKVRQLDLFASFTKLIPSFQWIYFVTMMMAVYRARMYPCCNSILIALERPQSSS